MSCWAKAEQSSMKIFSHVSAWGSVHRYVACECWWVVTSLPVLLVHILPCTVPFIRSLQHVGEEGISLGSECLSLA
jgi:hypothetical protein